MIDGGPRPWQGGPERDEREAWGRAYPGRDQPEPPPIKSEESGFIKHHVRDAHCLRSPTPEPQGEGGRRYKIDMRIIDRSRRWVGKTVYSGWSNLINPYFAELEKINDVDWVERVAASYTDQYDPEPEGRSDDDWVIAVMASSSKPYTEDRAPRPIYHIDVDENPRRGKTAAWEILGGKNAERLKKAEKKNKVAEKRNSRYQGRRAEKLEYLKITRINRLYAVLKKSGNLVVPSGPLTYLNILNTNKYTLKKMYEKEFGKIHRNKFNKIIQKAAVDSERILRYYTPKRRDYGIVEYEGDEVKFTPLVDDVNDPSDFIWSKIRIKCRPLQIFDVNGRDYSNLTLMYHPDQ